MKYMLIMNTPRDGYTQYLSWPRKILEANMAFMHSFTKKLSDAGELVGTWGAGVTGAGQADSRRQGRQTDHRRRVPRIQGVPGGLLDR